MSNVTEVTSPEQLKELLSRDLNRVSLLSFWAGWAEPCKAINEIVKSLAVKYPDTLVLSIEAEEQNEISESFDIESVPTCVLLRGHTLLKRITGADAPVLTAALDQYGRAPPQALSTTTQQPAAPPDTLPDSERRSEKEVETPEQLTARLRGLMNMDKRVLFMKGTPDVPQCGFSRQFVAILKERNVPFSHFNIYTDESVRQGLKVLNNWPTFPQFIVNGELVGGLDIIKDLIENDEFDKAVDVEAK